MPETAGMHTFGAFFFFSSHFHNFFGFRPLGHHPMHSMGPFRHVFPNYMCFCVCV